MLLKSLGWNTNKSSGNAFAIFTPPFGCCGDDQSKVIACRYAVTIDSGALATVDHVSIGGVDYTFTSAYATTTVAGREGIIAEIKAIMQSLGYEATKCFLWTSQGSGIYMLHTEFSDVSFDWLDSSTYQFVPIECAIYGHVESENVGFQVRVQKLADTTYNITVQSLSGKPLELMVVTYATVERTDSGTTPVPAGGVITFNVAGATVEASNALIVALTPVGGDAVSKTITEVFSKYTR